MPADLHCCLLRGPGRQRASRRRDGRVLFGARPATGRAAPALLAPHQPDGLAERWQIHQNNGSGAVANHRPPAHAHNRISIEADVDFEPPQQRRDPDDSDMVGQAYQQRAHARSIDNHGGSSDLKTSTSPDSQGPRLAPRNLPTNPQTRRACNGDGSSKRNVVLAASVRIDTARNDQRIWAHE